MSWSWVPRFAVDGGMTTGVAWGCFPSSGYGSVRGRVKRGLRNGGFGYCEVGSGGPFERPEINAVWGDSGLIALWERWNESLGGLYPTRIVLEDFAVGQSAHGNRSRSLLQSVRVCVAFESAVVGYVEEGMEYLHVPTMYRPVETKGYATDARLRDWGLWIKGSDHVRDACRLLALDIAKEVG